MTDKRKVQLQTTNDSELFNIDVEVRENVIPPLLCKTIDDQQRFFLKYDQNLHGGSDVLVYREEFVLYVDEASTKCDS